MAQESRSTAAESPRPSLVRWEIPIIDGQRRLVGWTVNAPRYLGGLVHHPEAEKLIGGPIVGAYVQIEDADNAQRAGAPPNWKGPWRCLGLCSPLIVGTDGSWSDVHKVTLT